MVLEVVVLVSLSAAMVGVGVGSFASRKSNVRGFCQIFTRGDFGGTITNNNT